VRELKRNAKATGEYSAANAQAQYRKRRKRCRREPIMGNAETAAYVMERLEWRWSPEQIAERAALEGYPAAFSYVTIYRAIDQRILPYSLKKRLRFKGRYRRHKADDKRGKIQDGVNIRERPASIEERQEAGHWESDTILGQRKTGAIGTHVERKTGFLVAFKLENRTNKSFNIATIKAFSDIPPEYRKTFTVDNGTEFIHHKELAQALGTKIYFCDPYSPWQRATNENTNGLLRQFFPKGSSFIGVTDEVLAGVVALLNSRPRKRLGWKSPAEVFYKITFG
jgi:IS30 family transposase